MGHWDVSTVDAYALELARVTARLYAAGHKRGSLLALVDARDVAAQSQEVVAAFKERFGAPNLQPRKLATVLTRALFKRQVERIAIGNQKLFVDESEAMEWLLNE